MKKNKVHISQFIQENRFELHSYLTYLFNMLEKKEDQMAKQ